MFVDSDIFNPKVEVLSYVYKAVLPENCKHSFQNISYT